MNINNLMLLKIPVSTTIANLILNVHIIQLPLSLDICTLPCLINLNHITVPFCWHINFLQRTACTLITIISEVYKLYRLFKIVGGACLKNIYTGLYARHWLKQIARHFYTGFQRMALQNFFIRFYSLTAPHYPE